MELCKFTESGMSVMRVPGSNGTGFSREEQSDGIFIEGNTNNKMPENGIIINGTSPNPVRDVSFSSYLCPEEENNLRLLRKTVVVDTETGEYNHESRPKGTENNFMDRMKAAVEGLPFGSYPYAGCHVEMHNTEGIKTKPKPEKQTPCGIQSFGVIGKLRKESEIGVFEAEKYFSTEEEKKIGAFELKNQAKNKVFFPSEQRYELSRHRISSPLPSIDSVRRSVNTRRSTPTASSEASWNSYSGLLPQSTLKFPASEGKKMLAAKWGIAGFRCKCFCSSKKSVKIDNSLTEHRRAESASNSLSSSAALMDSPLSSIKYSYSCGSIEKHRSQAALAETVSEISDINSSSINGGGSVKSVQNLLTPIVNQNSAVSKYRKQIPKIQRNNASLRRCDMISLREELKDKQGLHHIKEGFSSPFSYPSPRKSVVKPKSSVEVFRYPFSSTSCGHEAKNLSDLDSRLVLFSVDKAQKCLTLSSEASMFFNDHNARAVDDGDEDKESDSSSDLFELQSLAMEGTCYSFRRSESVNDTFSIQSGYPPSCEISFQSSFHSRGIEDPVTPSGQISYYEPSEASLDLSANSGDTIDNASLGNFSVDFEDMRMKKTKPVKGSDKSGLGEAKYKGGIDSRRSSGGFLGCGSQKALSVEPPTNVSIINKYDQTGRSRSNSRSHSFGLARGIGGRFSLREGDKF